MNKHWYENSESFSEKKYMHVSFQKFFIIIIIMSLFELKVEIAVQNFALLNILY